MLIVYQAELLLFIQSSQISASEYIKLRRIDNEDFNKTKYGTERNDYMGLVLRVASEFH